MGADIIEASVSVDIMRDVDEVFHFLLDATNETLWIKQIIESQLLTARPIGKGSRFRQVVVGPLGSVRVEWEVDEILINRRIHNRSRSGKYQFEGGFAFSPWECGVSVLRYATFQRTGVLRVVPKHIGSKMMEQIFRDSFLALKSILEDRSSGRME
ncbi:hypothetical protein MJD09_25690 [bacterium]|nr:hypothetical protein [bacterium]